MRRLALLLLVAAVMFPLGCRIPLKGRPAGSQGSPARVGQSASSATGANAPDSTAAGSAAADSAAADSARAKRAAVLPVPDLGYNAREGRAVYRHYCLNCHGDTGAGDGFNAYNLDPHPRALADSVFQATHSDNELAAAIRSGGGAVGLSTGMPPWGRTLSERKIKNTVEYLRSFRVKAKEVR
jgi:mono/diheme cytochrome c family protein